MLAVRTVLDEIGAGDVPELVVVNKADRAPEVAAELVSELAGSVAISAAAGTGIDDLLRTLGDRLRLADVIVTLRIPHDRGDLVAAAHREGEVIDVRHDDDGAVLRVVLDDAGQARFDEWKVLS